MAKPTTTKTNHYNEAQTRLWEAYTLLQMTANADSNAVDVFDMQTAIRGVLALMDKGLDHLREM